LHQTHIFSFELAEYLLFTLSYEPLLDCETKEEVYTEAPKGDYEVIYEELDLAGGVEGMDYGIAYEVEEVETKEQ
jgi:hypothetical protein